MLTTLIRRIRGHRAPWRALEPEVIERTEVSRCPQCSCPSWPSDTYCAWCGAHLACHACHGTGWVPDSHGDAEPCDCCGEVADADDWQPSAETQAGVAAGIFPF